MNVAIMVIILDTTKGNQGRKGSESVVGTRIDPSAK